MTARNILIVQGHPDTLAPHLCHALADAYAQGARDLHVVVGVADGQPPPGGEQRGDRGLARPHRPDEHDAGTRHLNLRLAR